MKKHIILMVLTIISLILITGCNNLNVSSKVFPTSNNVTKKTSKTILTSIDDGSVSILSDRKFKRGFVVRGLGLPIYKNHADEETFGDPYETGVKFQYNKDSLDSPVWEICQWSSRYAFHDSSITTFTENGTEYTYRNPSKVLIVNTSTGEFTLGLDADKCYVYGDRDPPMEWPHLLIARDINRSVFTKISDKEEIRIHLDSTLERYEDKMTVEPYVWTHAAQCMFYLYISNYDESTNNYTDMLWLGMTIFDNRFEYTEEFARPDTESKESATGKYIYNVANSEYYSDDNSFYKNGEIKVGSSIHIDFDILPYVKIALEKAKEDNCMSTSSYDNLYISGMYIGFELPGTYNLEMSFRNMDIRVK